MRKFNLIWIMILCLLVIPIVWSDTPDYYLIAEANNITGWNDNDNEVLPLGNNKWMIYSNFTIDNEDTQRGKIMESLFFDGFINSKITNLTHLYTSDANDNGKRGIKARIYTGDVPQSDTASYTGTFNDTTNNSGCYIWSRIDLTTAGNSDLTGRLEVPTGNTIHTLSVYNGDDDTSDELGTGGDTFTNPSTLQLEWGGSYSAGYYNSDLSAILLCRGNISWVEYYWLGDYSTYSNIDYYNDYNIPLLVGGSSFLISALDNYTQYGYEQTDITNFTATITNGTHTYNETANISEFVVFTDIEGLWNITITHDDYNSVTYENYNISTDLTAYMTQTHEHTDEQCYECIQADTYVKEDNPDAFYNTSTILYAMGDDANIRRIFIGLNASNLKNLSGVSDGNFYWYKHSDGGQNEYFTLLQGNSCDDLDANGYNWNNQPSCNYSTSWEGQDETGGWKDYDISDLDGTPTSVILRYGESSEGGTSETEEFRSKEYAGTTYDPYLNLTYVSNFTIESFDDVTGDEITTTPINITISNGAWSRNDVLDGESSISYPFDEGIYNISITAEGATQTHTNYDLSSESNYLVENMIFYVNITNCTSGDIALNFTIKDEENDDLLTSELEADFTLTTDFSSQDFNFDLSGNSSYQFCLNPSGLDVTLDGFVNYVPEDNENYSYARSYYFNDATINGDTQQDITLYALEDSYATEITFNVQEDGNNLDDATIYAERYDIGTGNYLLVAMGETDASGQTTMYLRYGDAYYKFLVYSNGELRKTDGPSLLSTTSKTFYLFSSIVEDDYLETWIDLQEILYSFSYNNATNVSSLSYSSPAGTPLTQGCLRVTKIDFGGEDEVCYSCESSASATITCLLTDLDADYRNEFIAYVDDTYYIMASNYLSLTEKLSDKIGLDGVFISIFIIGLLAFVGLFNPASAIIFALLGVILVSMFGLIDLGLTAVVAIIFVGVVLAFKLKT